MAWVINRAFPGDPVDPPFKHYNRTTATPPIGALTPLYAGERVLDTVLGKQHMALGTTSATWVESGPTGPD